MSTANGDLHGSVPDKSDTALLLIDVINDLEFLEGEELLRYALPMARQLAVFKQRTAALGIPTIYANDNFGRWRSDFQAQVEHCLRENVRGRPIAELLCPGPSDYFVLKPKHSAFYSTNLEILLAYLGVKRVILSGVATNICVLFTANDAYLRDLDLMIPRDCVAANTSEETNIALRQMESILKADVRLSSELLVELAITRQD